MSKKQRYEQRYALTYTKAQLRFNRILMTGFSFVLSSFFPYFLVDAFVKNRAIAFAVALVFCPLFTYTVYKVSLDNEKKYFSPIETIDDDE